MTEGKVPVLQGIADIVREKSKGGQLVSSEELFQGLKPENGAAADDGEAPVSPETIVGRLMAEHGDVKELRAKDETSFCYSSLFMSETYAALLLRREEGPAALIADTVREDSDRYPRPTPLDIFKEPPFDLNQEELLSCLETMSKQEDYQDIRQVSTSIGHVFLYSSKYLDQDYALMLAEWTDVGQFENP